MTDPIDPRPVDATSTPSSDSVPRHDDVSAPPASQYTVPVYASAPVGGALGGYPPLSPPASQPAKKSRVWLWLTLGAAGLLVLVGTTTVVAIGALTPRNESFAQKICLNDTADQMKNPASTKFSKIMVAGVGTRRRQNRWSCNG